MMIVAELSCSHGQSLTRALDLITAAKESGADAVKFQTWSPDLMVGNDITLESGAWKGWKLSDLYAKAWTPWDWLPHLIKQCEAAEIDWLSSVFDKPALDFLEKHDCPRYKIASFEITDIPLIRAVAETGKPIIMSTGVAMAMDLEFAVGACFREHLTILHCVSEYPARADEYDMLRMRRLGKIFRCKVGVSDHTVGVTIPVIAAAMGADVIEKHLTLSKLRQGIGGSATELDDDFASTPQEFAQMSMAVNDAIGAMQICDRDTKSHQLRRSAWLKNPIKKNGALTNDDILIARPEGGLAPRLVESMIGKKALKDIQAGPLLEDDFE